jgi:hypothetical protein
MENGRDPLDRLIGEMGRAARTGWAPTARLIALLAVAAAAVALILMISRQLPINTICVPDHPVDAGWPGAPTVEVWLTSRNRAGIALSSAQQRPGRSRVCHE